MFGFLRMYDIITSDLYGNHLNNIWIREHGLGTEKCQLFDSTCIACRCTSLTLRVPPFPNYLLSGHFAYNMYAILNTQKLIYVVLSEYSDPW